MGTLAVGCAVRVSNRTPARHDALLHRVVELLVRRKADGRQAGLFEVDRLGQPDQSDVVVDLVVRGMNHHLGIGQR